MLTEASMGAVPVLRLSTVTEQVVPSSVMPALTPSWRLKVIPRADGQGRDPRLEGDRRPARERRCPDELRRAGRREQARRVRVRRLHVQLDTEVERCQVEGEGRTEAARADEEHAAAFELLLSSHAHFGYDQVAAVAADFVVR